MENDEFLQMYVPLDGEINLGLMSAELQELQVLTDLRNRLPYGPWLMRWPVIDRIEEIPFRATQLLCSDTYGLELAPVAPIIHVEIPAGADLRSLLVWERCRNKARRMISRGRIPNRIKKRIRYFNKRFGK